MSRDADVLNRLIARLRSAAAGYRKAGADGPGLADVFAAAADSHDRTAEALEAMARALGGEPMAAAHDLPHPAWSDLPRAVAQGERATAEAIEAIESDLLRDLSEAVEDSEVSAPVRDTLARAGDAVKVGRGRALQRLDALAR